eukprot:Ihof_evm3s200 gene=Ihof_evmTU3s200
MASAKYSMNTLSKPLLGNASEPEYGLSLENWFQADVLNKVDALAKLDLSSLFQHPITVPTCNMTNEDDCSLTAIKHNPNTVIYPGNNTHCIDPNKPFNFQIFPGSSGNLLVYFSGGGACWMNGTDTKGSCYGSKVTTTGAPVVVQAPYVGIYDRTNPKNPFANYTIVQIGYCTGDVHTGDVSIMYKNLVKGKPPVKVIQSGKNNTLAVLRWMKKNIHVPEKLVVMGCSAGSVGAHLWGGYISDMYKVNDVRPPTTVIADSYAGVFPVNQRILFRKYGIGRAQFVQVLPDSMRKKLEMGLIYYCELTSLLHDYYSDVSYIAIQSKADVVQTAFFDALGLTLGFEHTLEADAPSCVTNSVPLTTSFLSASGFYNSVVGMYQAYNETPNFASFLTNSIFHCYTCYDRFYNTTMMARTGYDYNNVTEVSLVDFINEAITPTSESGCEIGFHLLYPDRFDFMLMVVFSMAGLLIVSFFYTGAYLGKNILCGVFTAVPLMLNLFEVTRVQNHPMLRETFALPFLWIEVGIMVWNLRLPEPTFKSLSILSLSTILFLLPWQFSQFPMLIQAFALFLLYCIDYVSAAKLAKLYTAQIIAVLFTTVAMFFNEMLITSLLFFFLISGLIITQLDNRLKFNHPLKHVFSRLVLIALFVSVLKLTCRIIFHIEDDAHIFLLLRAHATGYEDFITLQYFCGQAYNLLPTWVFTTLTGTFVLPLGSVSILLLFTKVIVDWRDGNTNDPVPPFILAQSCGFIILGLLMLRMLPFFTPSWCLCASLLFTDNFELILPERFYTPQPQNIEKESGSEEIERKKEAIRLDKMTAKPLRKNQKRDQVTVMKWLLRILIGSLLVIAPYDRFMYMMEREPSYRDHQASINLLKWVNRNTKPDSVITASLEMSSYIKLYTRRPITIHPHAEKHEMRDRYRYQYQLYARIPEKEVYDAMRHLQSDYVILTNCGAQCTNNKGYDYIASLNGLSTVNMSKPLFCGIVLNNPEALKYFK